VLLVCALSFSTRRSTLWYVEGVAVLGCSMVSLVTRVPALYFGMTMLCIPKGLSQYEER